MRLRLATAIGVIALTGCGSGDKTATKASSGTARAAATTPGGPRPYIGKWYAKLSSHEAIQKGDVRLAGAFRLELRNDGTYTTFQELDGATNGHYAVASRHRLVFKQDEGCDVFTRGAGSTGVYRWSVSGDHLRITNVVPETGGCTGRTQSLVFPIWQRR